MECLVWFVAFWVLSRPRLRVTEKSFVHIVDPVALVDFIRVPALAPGMD